MAVGQLVVGMIAMLCGSMAASAAAREQGAHVHGAGQLNIASDGKRLEIELIVPGADIVGFEHRPAFAAEKEAVTAAGAQLRAGDRLFAFPAEASCRFDKAKINLESADQLNHGHREHDHEDHAHDTTAGEQTHTEFHAQYQFLCNHQDRLGYIDVYLFQRFPAVRELSAQWILMSGQGAQHLTPASARLDF
jgi:hypothetical protein